MALRSKLAVAIAAFLALAAVLVVRSKGDDYTAEIVMPAATNLVKGSPVQISGATVGKVKDLEVRDGRAVITVSVDDAHAPLHDGTKARISYKALLGERILDLLPGPSTAPDLASGALIEGTQDRVELDQVLAALDAPTRARLKTLLARFSGTLSGKEGNVRDTIQALGPAAETLGRVLDAIGNDGPSIKKLITNLTTLTTTLDDRRGELASSVGALDRASRTIAGNRAQLQQGLKQLPATLATARSTLERVPSTVKAAHPLLDALEPGVEQLPEVSRQLVPLLRDLRPTVAQLRPTLAAARTLLGYTPGLLSGANTLLPKGNTALMSSRTAVSYLRPYTPELMGWLANWGSAAANYDANGHYLRAFIEEGTTSFVNNPGILPPGITKKTERLPGEAEGQPWTDANGSTMQ